MFRFSGYLYKDDDAPKMILSLDWFTFEDHWSQRFMFERAMYPDDMMERMRVNNLNRCLWFKISLNIMHLKLSVDVKLKKVGNVLNGRVMEDAPKPLRKRVDR